VKCGKIGEIDTDLVISLCDVAPFGHLKRHETVADVNVCDALECETERYLKKRTKKAQNRNKKKKKKRENHGEWMRGQRQCSIYILNFIVKVSNARGFGYLLY
jgi:hypothetical protein